MKIRELIPRPEECETFKRCRQRYVPEKSGCYALTTFNNVVLYIGLTNNLRRRMNEHLNCPDKVCRTSKGKPVLFHWVETDKVGKIERTWLNIHIQHDGKLPELNKIYLPISV